MSKKKKTNKSQNRPTTLPQLMRAANANISHLREFWLKLAILITVPGVLVNIWGGYITAEIGLDEQEPDFVAAYETLVNDTDLLFSFSSVMLVSLIYSLLAVSILTAAFIQTIKHRKSSDPWTMPEVLNEGIKNLWKVTVTTWVIGFLVLLGLIAFIVPGIIVGMMLAFAVTIRLDEPKATLGESLKKSKRLFTQNWAYVLSIMFIGFFVSIAVNQLLLILATVLPESAALVISAVATMAMQIYFGLIFTEMYFNLKQLERSPE